MNEVNNESKTAVIKVLAIIGLIALITFGIWLAVQAVEVIPNAFNSLASITDGVYNSREANTLTISTEKSIVNAGEAFSVSWSDVGLEGFYSFQYVCTDGISADVRRGTGEVVHLNCGDALTLPSDVRSIEVIAFSEKQRFVDVPFTVSFSEENTTEIMYEENGTITIVNATIPQSASFVAEEENEENDEVVTEDNGTSERSVHAVSPTPTVNETVVSRIPVSDPNGFVDVKMTYLGVGTLNGNAFVPAGTIDNDVRGAIRFEVRNIGSKTSDNWTFSAMLPTGSTFNSDAQEPLKPNERALITLGFDASETGTKSISGEASVPDDINNANNSFSWSVNITD